MYICPFGPSLLGLLSFSCLRQLQGEVRDCLVNVRQVIPSSAAFAALRQDGSVITWGDPQKGGDSQHVSLTKIQHLAATASAYAAISQTAGLVTWGDPEAGGVCSEPPAGVLRLRATAGGAFAAILKDGSVTTWGDPETQLRWEVLWWVRFFLGLIKAMAMPGDCAISIR